MKILKAGHWLGLDIGSARKKICSFCLIESDGNGVVEVSFEKGAGREPYPAKNSFAALIDPTRAPTYLKADIEEAVGDVLSRSTLVARWLHAAAEARLAAVAVDAPVAFAVSGERMRQTEEACSQTFTTPDRETFENDLDGGRKLGFYNSTVFWKCIGLAIYRDLARRLDQRLPADFPQETLAAWTCARAPSSFRMRETFPSDVYKRANGMEGTLAAGSAKTLAWLVDPTVRWRGEEGTTTPTLRRLQALRDRLRTEIERGAPLPSMQKLGSVTGDLWDAFTCAYAACSEDHGGAIFHGWSGTSEFPERLCLEGAILTVATKDL